MDNKDRLKKLNDYNNKNEKIKKEIDLQKELNFSVENEFYKFVYENEFVLFDDPIDYDAFFVLKLKEYFILKHLSENPNRPLGVLETSKALGLKIDEGKNLFNSLKEKKLIKEVSEELYMRTQYTTLNLYNNTGYRYVDNKYYITISKIKNNINFNIDNYDRLKDLRNSKTKKVKRGLIIRNVGFFILSIFILMLYLTIAKIYLWPYTLTTFFLSLVLINLKTNEKDLDYKISKLENEIQLSELNPSKIEEEAARLFRSHQLELAQYYNEILKQSKIIFKWGIGCLVLGMLLIIISILIIGFKTKLKLDLDESKIIAILSGVGGLFSNIVAGFYMNMYNKTMKSLDSFHQRFVGTHHLHFGNLLLSKIDDRKLREEAYASIFKDMVISMDKTDDSTK